MIATPNAAVTAGRALAGKYLIFATKAISQPASSGLSIVVPCAPGCTNESGHAVQSST